MSTRWQIWGVAALFAVSVGCLMFNSIAAVVLPQQEEGARRQLRETALRLAKSAEALAGTFAASGAILTDKDNGRLVSIVTDALAGEHGVEGGFYLPEPRDEFAGFAFPSEPGMRPPHAPPHHPPHGHSPRREPPPREQSYIRMQAAQSASLEPGEVIVQAADIGPSRVVVATSPVGTSHPAAAVVWLMHRLTGPQQQAALIERYRFSTYASSGGIALALLLTFSLGRSLKQEREVQERLKSDLRRSEHLASLGMMLAGVAHEVRNPLAAIRSTVQLWQRMPQETQTPASLDSVIRAVDRINVLVTRLLQFSRPVQDSRTPVQVNAILSETLQLVSAVAEQQGVEITPHLAPELPLVNGSPQGLQQVLLNLATNALQAMPGGGHLECRTNYLRADGMVSMELCDTGPGLPPEVQERLFQPFVTTRDEGTGLGLALCREIVLLHDGRIEFESRPPFGTCCRVTIPAIAR